MSTSTDTNTTLYYVTSNPGMVLCGKHLRGARGTKVPAAELKPFKNPYTGKMDVLYCEDCAELEANN